MDLLIWCFHMSARSSPPSDDGRHSVANCILGFLAAQTKEPYQLFSLLVGNLFIWDHLSWIEKPRKHVLTRKQEEYQALR